MRECLQKISFNSSPFVLLIDHNQLHFRPWLHLGTISQTSSYFGKLFFLEL